MMQFSHRSLSTVQGLQQYKLMGSGKDGFDPFPDWSVYGLLQIWDNDKYANTFFAKSDLIKLCLKKSSESWTLYLKNIKSHGEWNGKNPFEKSDFVDSNNPYIAVITRATIRRKHFFKFWRYVPTSQQPLAKNKGLIYTKGIGEVPFLQMATFSLWRDMESLMDFAYNSEEHKIAIQKTRKLDWYREELFSRFQPYKSVGTWNGKNPLPL
ncbi:DUF3291 domain-containing protein [Maribacter sp. 2210JD10-5]|uniref:DUF3291 domain-containing protein n=1 Tax=Maribacter sp. 2210JD10-5 TaxID=3386272 RepID=UPI0039BC4510